MIRVEEELGRREEMLPEPCDIWDEAPVSRNQSPVDWGCWSDMLFSVASSCGSSWEDAPATWACGAAEEGRMPRTPGVGEGAFGEDVNGQACTIPVHGFSVGQKPGGGAVVDAGPFFFFFLLEKEFDGGRPPLEDAGVVAGGLAGAPLTRAPCGV